LKGYIELSKLSVFSLPDVENIIGNKKTSYSLINRLTNKGLVKKVRNNIYSCVNPSTGQVVASRYQIACAISSSAYISHHTAFEYYGLANQVYYEVYVSSRTKFRDFEFEGIRYKYVASKMDDGVITPKNSDGIKVTDLERTVIDSIKDFEKIAGFEELINCLSAVPYLNKEKLIVYLDSYNIQALYQKSGFLLEYYMHEKQLSKSFIDYCKNKKGKSIRYLFKETNKEGTYNRDWRLVVPDGLFNIIEQGCEELV